MCMHGGRRPRKTSFLYGGAIDLNRVQPQPRGTSPLGPNPWDGLPFATALERNYPQLLCKRVAKRAAIAANAKSLPKHGAAAEKN